MLVTVWSILNVSGEYAEAYDYLMGTDEIVPLDTPLCSLDTLFPGCSHVTISGDNFNQEVNYV